MEREPFEQSQTTTNRRAAIDAWTVRGLGSALGINARVIQIALGMLWILDAALQFQPAMWHRSFVTQMILPMAHGQPAPVGWLITNVGHFLLPDAGVWNFLFASLQLGIGIGLLNRRTVRPALFVSFAWCLSVWVVGEGLGLLLTGTASALTGAPGAVILYAAVGLLVLPRRSEAGAPGEEPAVGVASSAAGTGPLGSVGALGVWGAVWICSAVLWLLPASRAHGALASSISSAASGEPHWYAHFLSGFAGHFAGVGVQSAWVLAIASLVIGLGPLFVSRPTAFLLAGAALELVLWVTGQALGGILNGMATDPNAGPLIVLLAIALLPTVVPVRASVRTPISSMLRWHRPTTWGIGAGIAATLLLSATYPVATASASSTSSHAHLQAATAMPAMSMPGPAVHSAASSSSRGTHKGSSTAAMNMAGAAGLGVVDPHWSYSGPPIPRGEASLLTQVSALTDGGHKMQTPDCTSPPSANQILGATEYVQATSEAVAKYKDLSVAVAAGYVPVTSPAYPVVHYVNPAYLSLKYTMDPNHVQSLVYAFTPSGPVLVAAMYLMPAAGQKGPMPYGCLVQWHAHTNLCYSNTTHQIVGFTPCPVGTYNQPTAFMTHVWQVPVPGGPLALDPSDLQTMQAAVQAQQDGTAPTTRPIPSPKSTAAVGTF